MALISVVTTCKGRLEHLRATLPHLMDLPDCEVVVVDYDCPERSGDWVRAEYPSAIVAKVEASPLFNVSHARNVGAAAASAPWLLLVDADVVVSPSFTQSVRSALQPKAYFRPEPRSYELWGTLLVARADFEAIDGYDEAFEGWGSEDLDVVARLDLAGCAPRTFPGHLVTSLSHDDDLRGRFHQIPDLAVNAAINSLYRMAKMDLLRQGVSLNPREARDLYAQARAAVLAPGRPERFHLPLPPRTIAGRTLETEITYRLSAPNRPAGDWASLGSALRRWLTGRTAGRTPTK